MKNKRTFYILFFSLLVIAFYAVLVYAVPAFTKRQTDPVSTVRSFSFTDENGKIFTEKNVAGKVYLANFFFTTCKSVCPKMNNHVKEVYEHFKDQKDFLIVSHTSDPETDSAARLKHYADSMGVTTDRWVFLTGRKDSLYTQARLSYGIDDPKNNMRDIKDDFLHTQFLALVNRQGEVVKIYDGLKKNEIDDLINDAEKLLKEK
jgi:protein SCO1/2